jgi:hypothetical protein
MFKKLYFTEYKWYFKHSCLQKSNFWTIFICSCTKIWYDIFCSMFRHQTYFFQSFQIKLTITLSQENAFIMFINEFDVGCMDQHYIYYRWTVLLTLRPRTWILVCSLKPFMQSLRGIILNKQGVVLNCSNGEREIENLRISLYSFTDQLQSSMIFPFVFYACMCHKEGPTNTLNSLFTVVSHLFKTG